MSKVFTYIPIEDVFKNSFVETVCKYDENYMYNLCEKMIHIGKINYRDSYGRTMLMLLFRCERIVKLLIKSGADLNSRDYDGKTALLYAANYSENDSYLDVIKLLVEAGADINIPDNYGSTILHYIVHRQDDVNVETIKYLVSINFDINTTSDLNENALDVWSPFISHDIEKSINTMNFLIDSGLHINDNTLLKHICHLQYFPYHIKIVQLLIYRGAKLHLCSIQRRNAFIVAFMDAKLYSKYIIIKSFVARFIKKYLFIRAVN